VAAQTRPEPGPSMLGDIVLCPEFAADQATAAGHTLGQGNSRCSPCMASSICWAMTTRSRDEKKEMFALQRQLLEEWVADQVEALSPGPPVREGPAAAGQVPILRRTVTRHSPAARRGSPLIGLGGLFAAIDAAISHRVDGARRGTCPRTNAPVRCGLVRVMAERPSLHQSRCAAADYPARPRRPCFLVAFLLRAPSRWGGALILPRRPSWWWSASWRSGFGPPHRGPAERVHHLVAGRSFRCKAISVLLTPDQPPCWC